MKSSAPILAALLAAAGLASHPPHVLRPTILHASASGPFTKPRRRIPRDAPRPGMTDQILAAGSASEADRLLTRVLSTSGAAWKTIHRARRNHARRCAELRGAVVQAAAVAADGIVHAVAAELPAVAGDAPPKDIQWMPPGAEKVVAKRNGEAVELAPVVNAAAAAVVQAAFLRMKAAADRGEGDRPYFDFNHDDAEASAWPTEFYWGGDDPKTGGIRARVEWTAKGKEAVLGKTYRRFSPAFQMDESDTQLVGAPVNMGGLVNRAAFTRIAPVWSKDQRPAGDPATQPKPNTKDTHMKSLLAVLAKLGVISSSDLDEASAVAQAQSHIGALQTERDTIKTKLTVVEGERETCKAKATTAEAQLETLRTAHATSVVEAAVTAGRIPPQNEEVKAKWINLIKQDPKNADLLPEPNPALAGGAVVTAKPGESTIAKGGEEEHVVKAKAWAKAHGKTGDVTDLVVEFFTANPADYDAYRAKLSLGKDAGK